MADLTFPQPADLPDAAYFAFQSGRGRSGIISGLQLTPDFSVPEVTIAAGKAIIDRGNMQTVHPNIQPSETVRDAVAVVQIDPQTKSLNSSSINSIFLVANVANDDSATVTVNTTNTEPTPASVKIGEIDTSSNTVEEQWNLITNSATLSFPSESAADSESTRLREGTIVYDRKNNTQFTVTN
jgi:Zn-dependent metalloprotease